MPSRYNYTTIKKSKDGKRVFKPTMYPRIIREFDDKDEPGVYD